MPGEPAMSVWTRMCGQTWGDAALSFVGMWIAMMALMMLPSLVPMLARYRRAVVRTDAARQVGLIALVGLAYLAVWTVVGIVVYPLGIGAVALGAQLPAPSVVLPLAIGAVVLAAGALQFSAWKTRHLACCRVVPARGRRLPADVATAWRHGVRLGLHCSCSSAGPTAILLVVGLMDVRAMAAVTAAITAERLAPDGERVARGLGAIACGVAAWMLWRAAVAH